MAIKIQDKWARITIDRETLARLRRLADGKPVAAYLRELSQETPSKQEEEVNIRQRLESIEQKLDTATRPLLAPGEQLPLVNDPGAIRELIDGCTRETGVMYINEAFRQVDAIEGLTETQRKVIKRNCLDFLLSIAKMDDEEKKRLYEKVDKDNLLDGPIGEG